VDTFTFENGRYKTAVQRISFLAKTFPSIIFYPQLVSIVAAGSRQAKHGSYDTSHWCRDSLLTLRALERVGVSVEVTGLENITAFDGPCVYIGNHMSTLETFVLPTLIAPIKDTTFVVKQSLVDYPIFKHIMRARNPITVGRVNARDDFKAVLDGGTARLAAGMSVIIFPQTTRSMVFDAAAFNTIGIKLAKKAGVPIVPIALKTDAWGNGSLLKDYGKIDTKLPVHFAFGKPLRIKDRGTEEHEEIIAFIRGKLKEWDGTVRSNSASEPGA
jgi:1-acyl-sn-glycerol-3-phosphate acyltransferase